MMMFARSLSQAKNRTLLSKNIPKAPRKLFLQKKYFHQSQISKSSGVPLQRLSETFIDGTSAVYVEQQYQSYRKDPNSVHVSWRAYFDGVDKGAAPGQAHQLPPTITGGQLSTSPASFTSGQISEFKEQTQIVNLVRAFQKLGHIAADLDPLNMEQKKSMRELDYRTYGFTEADLDREFNLGDKLFGGFLAPGRPKITLRNLLQRLEETYRSTIGVEYMHLQSLEQLNWIREKFETPQHYRYSNEEKVIILDRLMWATKFERVLATKFSSLKRFGLDGCETLIPGLKALIDRSADLGIEHIVMGMPHRGRLNVLANVVRKPLAAIFHEFTGGSALKDEYTGSGDVKYHLGTSYSRPTRGGKNVHLSLLANPSHLEAVDPVVEGKTRAIQYYRKDDKHERVMSIQLHGDAAIAGQGVVYETIGLSGLENYTTGGTIHIVVNNQIGFTTDPNASRGYMYCTDLAKAAGVPVLHVNGDDPEAVVHVCEVASEWRQKFHKDIFIDIICYRKFGHNESDEPRYTQPMMYKKIDKQKPVMEKYSEVLKTVVDEAKLKEMDRKIQEILDQEFKNGANYKPHKNEWFESVWKGFKKVEQTLRIKPTGAPMENLKVVGNAIGTIPNGYNLHNTVKKIITARKQSIETGEKIDWATGEALAIGTLLLEKNHVRLSGQDVERGTFSHRHAVVHDQDNGKTYTNLNELGRDQEKFTITNSSLSEFGVLGFELGYSLANPNSLVMWEAQFGDFVNGAQVIIDQFISSGETKWKRQSGLVLLLPHGYDGQGPEHSSGRLERFLQLCDSDPDIIPKDTDENIIRKTNLQVVNVTTPANYFHVLRRQIHRAFRKPLIIMSPKNLLKHRLAVSSLKEMSDESPANVFQSVIGETHAEIKNVNKVVFCSGKVYYDLLEKRTERGVKDVALIRVEQIHPFPFQGVMEHMKKYPNAQVAWCQEEPKNMGSWNFVSPHLRSAGLASGRTKEFFPTYIGRAAAASPATGYGAEHTAQLEAFITGVLTTSK